VSAEVIRESLIQHFTHYILSTLIHNQPLKGKIGESEEPKKGTQGVVNSYVKMAFSYFDANHCGYLLTEDLLRALQNCGFSVSKKGWTTLVGDADKLYYKSLVEPHKLVGLRSVQAMDAEESHSKSRTNSGGSREAAAPVYIKDGNIYDIPRLIEQSEQDERLKTDLREKLKTLKDKMGHQEKQVVEFETRQKKMTGAIEKQNDEICALKREKEALRVKYEELRKNAESSANILTETLKKHTEDN
jgi:hypothetical protein